jgi:hypothetical protein
MSNRLYYYISENHNFNPTGKFPLGTAYNISITETYGVERRCVSYEPISKHINTYVYSNINLLFLISFTPLTIYYPSFVLISELESPGRWILYLHSDQRGSSMGHTRLVSFGMNFRSVLSVPVHFWIWFFIVVKMTIKILYNYHTCDWM